MLNPNGRRLNKMATLLVNRFCRYESNVIVVLKFHYRMCLRLGSCRTVFVHRILDEIFIGNVSF